MSIFSISDRINQLDGYLSQIDTKLRASFAPVEPSFDAALTSAISEDEKKHVKATLKPDNLSNLPEDFEDYIKNVSSEMSSEYGVEIPVTLVKSIIKQESGFNPDAVSHAGAQGLMQLMPATAKSLGVFNSLNPYQNVKGGVKYLAQMLDRFDGNLQKALAAYNAGPGAIEKHGGVPPYKETQNYVQSIMKDYLAREDYQSIDIIG